MDMADTHARRCWRHRTGAQGLAGLLALALWLPTCGGSGPRAQGDSPDRFAGARTRIEQLMTRQNIASFQVAVGKDGALIYEEAFGWANIERRVRTTTRTRHLVASISKPFASAALMILAERGRIALHRPVNDYLGGARLTAYRGNASQATVARMMLHTSGLPYGYYICGDEVPPEAHRTNRDLVALAGVLVTPPGTRFEYTNIGYGLLEDVAREAAGVSMKEFIRAAILEPLGLEHTGFFRSTPPAELVATQNADGGVLPIAFDADGYSAMYSTAGDLVRFGMFQLKARRPGQARILPDTALDMLWQHQESGVENSTRRLGWDVQNDFGFETVQHGGGGPGIHNWLYLIPSENLVIALLSNAMYSNAHSDPVLIELIGAALSPAGREKLRPWAGRGYPRRTEINPADFAGRWVGQIRGPKGTCGIAVEFDASGLPQLHLGEGDRAAAEGIRPNRKVSKGHKTLLWRFDASIPYLRPFADHDEVILTIWPEGNELIGSASAAKEKNFGKGENYVLPQYVELKRGV